MPRKQSDVCSRETHFVGSKYPKNEILARALPWTSLGKPLQTPQLDFRGYYFVVQCIFNGGILIAGAVAVASINCFMYLFFY